MRNTKFGLILKSVLGKNSPVTNMISVDIMVCTNISKNSFEIIPDNSLSWIISAIKIPYTTNAMLFPTNIVEMKLLGLRKKYSNTVVVGPGFLSISKRNLSTDTKAISIPEKNAENAIVINT